MTDAPARRTQPAPPHAQQLLQSGHQEGKTFAVSAAGADLDTLDHIVCLSLSYATARQARRVGRNRIWRF